MIQFFEPFEVSSSGLRFFFVRAACQRARGGAEGGRREGESAWSGVFLEGSEAEFAEPVEAKMDTSMSRAPTFDPRPFLDREGSSHYVRPQLWMKDADEVVCQDVNSMPAARNDWRSCVFWTLRVFPREDHDERFTNGLFAILKDQLKDRMILDVRCPNIKRPERLLVSMSDPTR